MRRPRRSGLESQEGLKPSLLEEVHGGEHLYLESQEGLKRKQAVAAADGEVDPRISRRVETHAEVVDEPVA